MFKLPHEGRRCCARGPQHSLLARVLVPCAPSQLQHCCISLHRREWGVRGGRGLGVATLWWPPFPARSGSRTRCQRWWRWSGGFVMAFLWGLAGCPLGCCGPGCLLCGFRCPGQRPVFSGGLGSVRCRAVSRFVRTMMCSSSAADVFGRGHVSVSPGAWNVVATPDPAGFLVG